MALRDRICDVGLPNSDIEVGLTINDREVMVACEVLDETRKGVHVVSL